MGIYENIYADRIGKLKKEIRQLEERLELLDALEAAGVDNWEGYDEALEILEKR